MSGPMPYREAIATLKSMFEGVDDAVIVAVLEANNMQLEPTIEQLLEMQRDAPAPSVPSAAGSRRRRKELPPGFLAIPAVGPASATSTPADQLAQDEALARMMQDERFMAELQQDPEVAAHLRRVQLAESARGRRRAPASTRASAADAVAPAPAGSSSGGWLASMGAGLRSRVSAMASRFGRGGGRGQASEAAAIAPTSSAPAHERAGLLEERVSANGDTEMDLDVLGDSTPPPAHASRPAKAHGFEPLV
ncbi:hypothetical protein FNF29_00317 [Cafeteria roenbergensis]|uniref:CUE domain-containing protein n=1 Tax=Cafeteria roenbergensis TaxID=33653 RepID=A0A5A8CX34_CAFRO|nr:hypothetical protein FNF29_00317 [Cafeteria roenbergensis]|eukprot:KAA0157743.1 hypothetical protein FNF29_00317 [Cafeteria roenbergensis]